MQDPQTLQLAFVYSACFARLTSSVVQAVSVSLPTWQDTLGWAKRDPDILAHLQTGYPRFFIHRLIDRLAGRLLQWAMRKPDRWNLRCLETPQEEDQERIGLLAMIFPHVRLASSCVGYLEGVDLPDQSSRGPAIFAFQVNITGQIDIVSSGDVSPMSSSPQCLCVVVYPERLFKEAKAFWQHTGFGISSRHAVYWSANASFLYQETDDNGNDKLSVLPSISDTKDAADTIRHRISGLLSSELCPVRADDVFLYSTGMSAIANSASALYHLRKGGSDEPFRVAAFGYVGSDMLRLYMMHPDKGIP